METPEAMRKFKKSKDKDGFVPEFSDASKQQVAVYTLKLETAPNDGHFEISFQLRVAFVNRGRVLFPSPLTPLVVLLFPYSLFKS